MKESPEVKIEINAPSSIVWQVLAGLDKYSEWSTRVKFSGKARQGATVKMTVKLFKFWLNVPVLLETVKEEQEFRWLGGPGILFSGSHYFKLQKSDTDPDSTLLIQGEQFRGLCVSILLPIMKGQLLGLYEDINRDLKKRAETIAVE